eukprot:CAMPEP_0182451222 /NCGR_PEP_ID=MMETSP1172-20130603/43599_1 /TAXON_ID=708627 /ORGANISM="Timspurckia oligopyrenoides, Strain CCMP3278" /LENGTH=319 /DNA_ID=CAMNT_0024648973 /DNA_START=95 /DNA_END=1054 /DNA_ORIENTATION=+
MNKVCIRASSISKDNVLEKSLNNESNSEWDIHVTSPAKINIFLRILRKREDGFHELASLFQAISLSDRLSLRSQSELAKDSMECNMPGVPTDSSNLILKALDVFRKNTGTKEFFHVRLEKNVPMEAGLGGGSANAASALWAINELSGRPATNAQLAEYGAEFGSDISFFFSNGTAYCTGRGEIMEEVESLPSLELYVVKPNVGMSTGAVFRAMDYNELSKTDPKKILNEVLSGNLSRADLVNDLEKPSFKLMPSLMELKKKLIEFGFDVVLMSGSGSSFYCIGVPNCVTWMTDLDSVSPGIFIQKARFINRNPDQWYST